MGLVSIQYFPRRDSLHMFDQQTQWNMMCLDQAVSTGVFPSRISLAYRMGGEGEARVDVLGRHKSDTNRSHVAFQ